MGDIEIRDARPEEHDEIAAVTLAGYAQYFPPEPWGPWTGYRAELADVAGRAAESEQIVAVREGRIVGAVAFYPVGTEVGSQGRPLEWASIRYLAVLPEARGHGIARKLTEECIRRARERGVKVVGLMTGNFMTAARGLYDSMGFVRVPDLDDVPAPGVLGMQYRMDL